MTSMVLGDSTLEFLTSSVNAPLKRFQMKFTTFFSFSCQNKLNGNNYKCLLNQSQIQIAKHNTNYVKHDLKIKLVLKWRVNYNKWCSYM
jgi:hypothetical protein